MKIMNLLTISLCAIALTMTVGCALGSGSSADDNGGSTPTPEADASAPADDAAAPADDTAAPADDAAAPADDDAAPADDAAAPADDAAAPAAGACTNESDMAIISDPANDIEGDAGVFGQSCLADADIGACTTGKLLEKYDLTPECGGCFAAIVGCTVEKCLLKCAANPAADECVCCRESEGCTPTFYECTGLPNDNPPDCE